MQKILHRENERGRGEYGWLKSRYSFSFADWHDPTRMGFGVLRVINDDNIAPDSGFAMHSHRDMEIITIVTRGTVTHRDSLGNEGTVSSGDVQVMSAGTGVTHSEFNMSKDEPLALFQIWILPKKLGIMPRYFQKSFGLSSTKNGLTLLVSPEGKGGLTINQDASIFQAVLENGSSIVYSLAEKGNGVYIFVTLGNVSVNGEELAARDALGITATEKITIAASSQAQILIIDVPMG